EVKEKEVKKEEIKAKEKNIVEPSKETKLEQKSKIKVNEFVTVKMLAEKLHVEVGDLIKKMMSLNILATINQRLNLDVVSLISEEFGCEIEIIPLYGEEILEEEGINTSVFKPRSPVVTIMGHVDHGKTSLLDAIRKTKIVEKEAGNITQHIGAYKVKTEKGDIVFLDTPGHEAFTAMRARGAQITDIVVLVVAADDGMMPQTVEAIDHARAAGVPIIVAINKIDLPSADPQRVKKDLANLNLLSEEWGGKTVFVEVSAKKEIALEDLLEMILLEAEVLELVSDVNGLAQGTVIEARLDPKKGILATVLIQKGTLKVRDSFVVGLTSGKVKAMLDDHGKMIKEAPPSTPVEIMGFVDIPHVGDKFRVMKDEKKVRYISQMRQDINRQETIKKKEHITLENLHQQIETGKIEELKIIIKADVRGSVEAVRDSLEKINSDKIKLSIIHSGVGGINEADVLLAVASDALVIGFNVRSEQTVSFLAEREKVSIKTYRVIYELVSDIRAAMEGLLAPQTTEIVLAKVEVRQVFRAPKVGCIAGCYVKEGKLLRNSLARLLRDNIIVYEGKINSLRHFKEDIREALAGHECGIVLENFQDVKENDIIEIFELKETPDTL
ncbi:translation initiation factor IF-2, partial [bacterium]|nr:translation initiation factor IF-2 [bacterium]